MFFRPKERLPSESVPPLTVSDALAEDVRSAQESRMHITPLCNFGNTRVSRFRSCTNSVTT